MEAAKTLAGAKKAITEAATGSLRRNVRSSVDWRAAEAFADHVEGHALGRRFGRTLSIDADLLSRLSAICMALPDVYEEDAWTGIRWCVGTRNFAHIVEIADASPPAYAKAAQTDGPAVVVTFRTPDPARFANGAAVLPFFWPGWFPNLVGVVLDAQTNWDELTDFLEESYRALASKRNIDALDAR